MSAGRRMWAAAGAVTLVVAGCGSSGRPAATGPAPTVSAASATTAVAVNYGKQYLADITPVNNQIDAFRKAYADASSVTAAQLSPLRDAMVQAGRELATQSWPANAQQDAHTLALDAEQAAAGLDSGLDLSNVADESKSLQAVAAQAQILRADLGLPPIS